MNLLNPLRLDLFKIWEEEMMIITSSPGYQHDISYMM